MIIKMMQVHSPAEHAQSYIEYLFYLKDNKIGTFVAKNPPLFQLDTGFQNCFNGEYRGQKQIRVTMEKNNDCPQGYKEKMLEYLLQETDGTKKSIGKYNYNYYDATSNEKVGTLSYITIKPPKKSFFDLIRAYQYQSLNFNGNIYDLYRVHANKKIFYCIHKDNQLVAIVEKHNQVINFMDNYTIYSLDGLDIDILCLIASHFDYINYEEAMPKSEQHTTNYVTMSNEFRQAIIEKYDPTFIQTIIDMENQSNT